MPNETVVVPKAALNAVLERLWDDEREDWEANGRPEEHIFLDLAVLETAQGPSLPELRCPCEHVDDENIVLCNTPGTTYCPWCDEWVCALCYGGDDA